jgi:hypothetical protein
MLVTGGIQLIYHGEYMYHSDTMYAHVHVCSLVEPKGRRRTLALGGVSYGYVVMLFDEFCTQARDAGSSEDLQR